MSKQLREVIADWLMLAGALVLLLSLFLAWSHQLPPAFRAVWARLGVLRGVPADPTAWQVYSAADIVLALLAAALVLVSFLGTRPARLSALVAAAMAVVFVIHAVNVPPTNGLDLATPRAGVAGPAVHATAGAGETVALVGLSTALAGLALSFTAD